LVEKLPGERQRGILYDTLVNTVRSQIPNRTEFVHAKVTDIATGAEGQTVKLSTGERDRRSPCRAGDRTEHRHSPEARHRP
jgi:hypothetical protein